MDRFLRKSAISVAFALLAVSTFAQERSSWRTSGDIQEGARGNIVGTVVDVESGRSRFTISPDDDKTSNVIVDTDTLATQYNGFGGTINGSPEIFVGSTGFSNLRTGDRVDVRGVGRANGNVAADRITLLGRPVEAPQTGIGQTRQPGSISTPTASQSTPSTAPERFGLIEGVVRQVNADQGRVVIETDSRQLINIRATNSTPVSYRGDTYRISNLEPGDRVRVTPSGGTMSGNAEIRATSIDVVQSVQDRSGAPDRGVGNLTGKVTGIDRKNNTITVDTGRSTVTVDLKNAVDSGNRRVRAADLLVGDTIDLSGSYSGETYVATSVRFGDESNAPSVTQSPATRTPAPAPSRTSGELVMVTIYGTVTQSLRNAPYLTIRDESGRTVRINLLEDFVVRNRTNGYTTADQLTEGEAVAVRAYRDVDGNYIAQTIRVR